MWGDTWEPLASRECPAERLGGLNQRGDGQGMMDSGYILEIGWTELVGDLAGLCHYSACFHLERDS